MNDYAVTWEPPAEDGLTEVWIASPDRNAVTRAAHRLDEALRRHPFTIGESRNSSVNRVALDPPLGVHYEIIEDDKRVRVLRVWAVG